MTLLPHLELRSMSGPKTPRLHMYTITTGMHRLKQSGDSSKTLGLD